MGGGEASGEGRKKGAILCLHYFFGSTEKQDVKDLPGLPRNRDPGEGQGTQEQRLGSFQGPSHNYRDPLTPFHHGFIAICRSLLICLFDSWGPP